RAALFLFLRGASPAHDGGGNPLLPPALHGRILSALFLADAPHALGGVDGILRGIPRAVDGPHGDPQPLQTVWRRLPRHGQSDPPPAALREPARGAAVCD